MEKKQLYDCLEVSHIDICLINIRDTSLKGLASIVLNDQFVIRGLRIVDGEHGLFIGYPNDPFYKGEDFRTVCSPITRQLREHIENSVLEAYQSKIAEAK